MVSTLSIAKDDNENAKLPLADSELEQLTFTTSEGSWLSLDVSPDGKHIIFDLLGDLYQLPINGGEANRITSGLAYDAQPVYAPDGRRIAFISDRDGANNLWVADIDGSNAVKLSDEKYANMISPRWTPDGMAVVVTRDAVKGPELVLYAVDGGSGVVMSSDNEDKKVEGVGAAFSPNGEWLYYASSIGAEWEEIPATQVKRLNLRNGTLQQLTQGNGGGFRPVLSPDGKLLVYGTRYEAQTGLRIRHLESEEDRWLAYPVQRDNQENYRPSSRGMLPGYGFTPDSQSLIYYAFGGFHKIAINTSDTSDIPFTAEVALDIGQDVTSPYQVARDEVTATIAHTPVVSNDGQSIAASLMSRLYITDIDGKSQPRAITPEAFGAYEPAWSPDDKWLVFASWTDNNGGHIWKVRADGRGNPQQITTHAAYYTDLTYSQDGKTLFAIKGNAFQRHQTFSEFTGLGISTELVSLPAWGGEMSNVVHSHPAIDPHVRNTDNRIYLYDPEAGALFSVKADGHDRRTHLFIKGANGNRGDKPVPAERAFIHADKPLVVALVNKQVWLIQIPDTGGKAPEVDVTSSSLPTVQLTNTGADFIGWNKKQDEVVWALGNRVFRRSLQDIVFREDNENDDDKDQTEGAASKTASGKTSKDEKTEEMPEPLLDAHESVKSVAITVKAPVDIPQGQLLLKNANVITMAGNSLNQMTQVQRNMDILIHNNRIHAVGENLSTDAQTQVLDMAGKYILPGFIDTHAHWEFRTQDVLEPHNWSLAANLAYGVTSGLDVQTSYHDYFTYRDMVATGQITGQRAFMTGPGVFGVNDFDSYEAVEAYLKRYSDFYRTKNLKAYTSGNRQQRQWLIKAAKKLGLMPTTEGAGDQKMDLTHAIDGFHGNEHNLPDTPLYNDVITLYAETKTAYTPTLIVQYNSIAGREYFFTKEKDLHNNPRLRRFYPHNQLDNLIQRRPVWALDSEYNLSQGARDAANIQRAGGLIGVGGHAEFQGLGYHWEMWAYAMGGMSNQEILKAATIDGAQIIGISQDLGSIEKGKLADLVILNSNPLESIRNSIDTHAVVQNGRIYDPETLTQVWPEKKPFPAFWWWDEK
ncbi:MAG: amidohydrolase family protein [Aestuariibacter sp.]